ncbi:amino acid permease [Pseudomonas gingeri]|uniref:amino acid permease n=1 Tax=Pseudomonas gingeri TaxID=117681 RepID=UPI0015A155D6|nr:amino acid permease [Pseudomonas gingeri]NWA01696.1 amino acid permease [Pseudomonas gingeri]NWA12795.1 amino acid permease [Pseudomonas gingeri]NWA57537.1 amino acid permease [Pseudomonas gingeri]NWA93166.1 amino acid permease [Pseudomonas gingeri]NWB03474.1 amino acid permease [Pseudomonas gingeri]
MSDFISRSQEAVAAGATHSLESGAGYQAQFERSLGKFESFAVAFSFISITTGLFSTYGSVLVSSGPIGIWTWPIVTLGTLLVALVFGLLASKIPLSGFSYQWASRLVNPVVGWWFGWASFAFTMMVAVAVDYGLAQVALFPLLGLDYTPQAGALTAAAVFLIQGALIIWSTPLLTRINNMAVAAEVIAVIGLIVGIGVAVTFFGKGNLSNLFSTGIVHSDHYYGWLGPFMLSGLLGAFTLVGWEAAANMAEETHNPKQVVPRAMANAVLISGVMGTFFLIVISMGLGDQVAELTKSSAPVADVIRITLGETMSKLILVVVCVAIFACGLVIMTSNSRLVHSMARDGRLPFSEQLSRVPRATGGPSWATVFVTLVSVLVVLSFYNSPDALTEMLGAATLFPALLYSGTVILYIATRHKHVHHADDFTLGKWEWPVVIGACVWLAVELCVFIIPSDFRVAQMYVLASMAVGAVIFACVWMTRRKQLERMPPLH